MSRAWLALAAALLALGAERVRADTYSYDWGGQAHLSGYYIDQDEVVPGDVNDFGFAGEGKVWGRVRLVADKGTEYGLRALLRFQSSEAEFSNDVIRGAPDFVDEVWFYVHTLYGQFSLGLEDGAADAAGIFSPTVSDVNRIDDARHYVIQDPLRPSFNAFAPNGAHMRTDLNGSGDALKLVYYSPRLIGLQLSASYMPELTRGFHDLFDGDDFDEQSHIWEVGLNYQGALSGFDVGFYAGYAAGTNERPTPANTVTIMATPLLGGAPAAFTSVAFTPGDLEEYGAGAQVVYEGFSIGGSYRVTNIAGGAGLADRAIAPSLSVGCSVVAGCVHPDTHTTIWGAGIGYETGPWKFGANYVNLEEELPPFVDGLVTRFETQDGEAWMGAVGFEVDENLRFAAGYQHYAFDGPVGACVAAACDTLDADLGFFQSSFSF